MIKFLHTADLHLGKTLHDQSLDEDQQFMLNNLTAILADTSYTALIIAGDVYDRSIPSPEAVGLFDSFLGNLKRKRPDIEILVIPGNHDSPVRLGFGKNLFAELGIHFVTSPEDADKSVIIKGSGGESYAFFLLPFLSPGSLMSQDGALFDEAPRSQVKLASLAASRLEKARLKKKAEGIAGSVLAAHLFAAGGEQSDSERIFLGNAEQVAAKLFAGFDYLALGHLHSRQKAGDNGWYSGSPLAYSFGEAGTEKFFLSVEIDKGKTTVSPLPVKPLRRLSRLSGSFDFFLTDAKNDENVQRVKDDYLEIDLSDTELRQNALARLRPNFPHLLNISWTAEAFSGEKNTRTLPAPGERRNTGDDFVDFLTELYGTADKEKLDLFQKFLAEIEEGERGA
jgi:exonuclease SbcD